jgi:nucleoside-diphosphate-sugar epimerase
MKVLFIGGTGLISSACASAVQEAGHELWLVTRGKSTLPPVVPADHIINVDATDSEALRSALKGMTWNVVVQWVAFEPGHILYDIETFADAGQYVFISSASVYEKPPSSWLITERTPKVNPYWAYAQNKIACEEALLAARAKSGFPMTIVRPSLTYGPSQIPVIVGSWSKPFTIVDRMRRGAKIIVPGDGTAIWTLTHNSDFAHHFGRGALLESNLHVGRRSSRRRTRRHPHTDGRDRRRGSGGAWKPLGRQGA